MKTVVKVVLNVWDAPQGEQGRLVIGMCEHFTNLLKAYNWLSEQLEKEGIEIASYSTVQKNLARDGFLWAKHYWHDAGHLYASFKKLEVH